MRQDTYFYSGTKQDAPHVTVITGVCRSGKTLLGNLLATCGSVEYADEPWTAMLLPMVVRTGKVDQDLAHGWLKVFVSELFNDLVLLRSANFRPNDLSSIWTKKTPEEVNFRLTQLATRQDVNDYVRVKNLSLIMTLAECGPFTDVIECALGNVHFVHVIRDGFDVAADVAAKGWFSDMQLKQPLNAQLYARFEHGGIAYHLPWWVDAGDEQLFLQFNEYERGLYYWCSQIEKTLEIQRTCDMRVVKYGELVAHPRVAFDSLSTDLGLPAGPLTDACIKQIAPRVRAMRPSEIAPGLYRRTSRLNEQLGMQND